MARIETEAPAPAGARVLPESENTMETENNTTATAFDPTAFDSAPAERGMFDEYSREALESMLTARQARVAELENENRTLRFSQIDGDDSRLSDFWDKARRIAEHAGFCTEYDKIAVALGGPARMLDWSGTVDVTVTVTVPVRVGGTATPEEIENHTMDYEVDDWDVHEALKDRMETLTRYDLDSETDTYSLEVTETEPASN